MASMFHNCYSLTSINFNNSDTSNLEIVNSMFYNCSALTSIDLSGFYTRHFRDIHNLFTNCTKLSYIDISTFHETLDYNNEMFKGVKDSGEIIISKNISTKIHQIFEDLKLDWTITEE